MESTGSDSKVSDAEVKEWSETKVITSRWRLLDHPDLMKQLDYGLPDQPLNSSQAKMNENEQISTLMKAPRNEIVRLPSVGKIKKEFKCAICGEIPFPWKGPKDKDAKRASRPNMDGMEQGVMLCHSGHPICRQCFSYVPVCGAWVSRTPEEEEEAGLFGNKESSSMTNFGSEKMCKTPISHEADGYLENMIAVSEFSCRFFYNNCAYRGKGPGLKRHEEMCPFNPCNRKKRTGNSSNCTDDTCQEVPSESSVIMDEDKDAVQDGVKEYVCEVDFKSSKS